MAEFFKTSTTWVVDFRYDGRPRRWFKSFGPGVDVEAHMTSELQQLHGRRAQIVRIHKATDEEEAAYLRGGEPKPVFCPTGRGEPPSAPP